MNQQTLPLAMPLIRPDVIIRLCYLIHSQHYSNAVNVLSCSIEIRFEVASDL